MSSKKDIAEALGIKCAGLLVTIKIGKDGGEAHRELFIECNGIFVDFAKTKFPDPDDAIDAVGKGWDIFWEIFWEGEYIEMNKFVGFVNTIILRLSNTKPKDIDKNPIIHIEIEKAIENPDNDPYFEQPSDDDAILEEKMFTDINEAMKTFSLKDQELRRRFYIVGEKQQEIADALGLTVGYVGKALSRIVAKLKRLLT